MTETMELRDDPVMYPTIVRRVHEGGLETVSRTSRGRDALCVFWSIEHAERDMSANGFPPEEGWKAIERDRDGMAAVLDLMGQIGKAELVYLEPAPTAPDLHGVFTPEDFIALLDASDEDDE